MYFSHFRISEIELSITIDFLMHLEIILLTPNPLNSSRLSASVNVMSYHSKYSVESLQIYFSNYKIKTRRILPVSYLVVHEITV